MAEPIGKVLCKHYDHLESLLEQTSAYLLMRGQETRATRRLVHQIKTKAKQLSDLIPLDEYPKLTP